MFTFWSGLIIGYAIGAAVMCALFFFLTAIPDDFPSQATKRSSFYGFFVALIFVVAVASVARYLPLHKAIVTLLFVVLVLAIARIKGLVAGLTASAFAGFALLYTLPPSGSLLAANADDRVLVILFVLSASLASRWVDTHTRAF